MHDANWKFSFPRPGKRQPNALLHMILQLNAFVHMILQPNAFQKNWETCLSAHIHGNNCKEVIKNEKHIVEYNFTKK